MVPSSSPVILVTGSSGRIGSALCKRLKDTHEVIGADLHPPEEEPQGDHWIQCDLTDDSSVRAALDTVRRRWGGELHAVVHLAAYYDFSGEPSPLYRELTVEGTRRLLRGLQSFEVGQFLFSSSVLVMKFAREGELLDEDSPVEATWDYPRSKLEAEAVIREERGRIPAVVLRIAGVYDEDCHSIPLAQHISRIHQKKLESFLFPGNPHHGQPFVHVQDVVDSMECVFRRRAQLEPHEVFLVGEPEVLSYAELQDVLGELLHGREWPTIRIPALAAKAGAWLRERLGGDEFIKPWMVDLADAHCPITILRARLRLGWHPCHALRAELPEMVWRLQDDPARWYRENGLEVPEEARE
jgi:nucleoside-diphosphate-sugar epimerase